MKEVTLKIMFQDESDYYKFMDNISCSDENENIRIPHNCKIRLVKE